MANNKNNGKSSSVMPLITGVAVGAAVATLMREENRGKMKEMYADFSENSKQAMEKLSQKASELKESAQEKAKDAKSNFIDQADKVNKRTQRQIAQAA